MSSAKSSTSSQQNRSRVLQSVAFIFMIVVPIFLYFAALSQSQALVVGLLLIEAVAMAVSMLVS